MAKSKFGNKPRKRLDDFTRGYIECALWSSMDESDESGGEPMDKNYSISDIAASTLLKMARDCKRFQQDHKVDLEAYCNNVVRRDGGSCMSYAGHDLWLTRNRHGSGYWDRDGVGSSGRPEGPEGLGERLSKAAHALGEFNLYVGDDGKIYGS